MAENRTRNLRLVEEFFQTLSDRDTTLAADVLSAGARLTLPYSLAGELKPERVFDGRKEILGYLSRVLENFDHAAVVDRETFSSEDGGTVFVEGRGDLTRKGTGQPLPECLRLQIQHLGRSDH